eukprot:CAMPEP_0197626132 /NCGR_PEP_ID=MMETSP1338-20131121/5242_1 /TAXON_ID=43686 ORGANISM="Pelagodinium beii, Strain RCC1491" /NCGR_SAMPLE_ID=MMETSP1338 /ASSEMBLY_ACC=CAM_ASM_000754 /LENGTH=72 /DNA_ID=CAMNT_0043196651 /DNA_START=181 /DNA_END=398 /DNA_ORIENTATION=+
MACAMVVSTMPLMRAKPFFTESEYFVNQTDYEPTKRLCEDRDEAAQTPAVKRPFEHELLPRLSAGQRAYQKQ